MTGAQLKAFFRTLIKVVAGGPPVGTVGSNRADGVLQALDALVDFAGANAFTPIPANHWGAGDPPAPLLTVNAAIEHLHAELNPARPAQLIFFTNSQGAGLLPQYTKQLLDADGGPAVGFPSPPNAYGYSGKNLVDMFEGGSGVQSYYDEFILPLLDPAYDQYVLLLEAQNSRSFGASGIIAKYSAGVQRMTTDGFKVIGAPGFRHPDTTDDAILSGFTTSLLANYATWGAVGVVNWNTGVYFARPEDRTNKNICRDGIHQVDEGDYVLAHDVAKFMRGGRTGISTSAGYIHPLADPYVAGQSHPLPVVTSISPTSGAVGSLVFVNGKNLRGITALALGSAAVGTSSSERVELTDGQFKFVVPAGATTSSLHVSTEAGEAVNQPTFTVSGGVGMTITDFTPHSAPAGDYVVITGTNFADPSIVRFGGINSLAVLVDSPTQITCTVPNGASTAPITVTHGSLIATSSQVFSLPAGPGAPTVSALSTYTADGSIVTITGANFVASATQVYIAGVLCPAIVVDSPTQTRVVIGEDCRTGDFVVTTASGSANAGLFTVPGTSQASDVPLITSVSSTGPYTAVGNELMEVYGENLYAVDVFKINGTAVITTAKRSAANWAVLIPVGATTGPITVETSHGTATGPVINIS